MSQSTARLSAFGVWDVPILPGVRVQVDPVLRSAGSEVLPVTFAFASQGFLVVSIQDTIGPDFGTFDVQNLSTAPQILRWYAEYTHSAFEANYRQGVLFLKAAPAPTEAVTASFCKAQGSAFIVRPPAGKRLLLSQAEVQFSTDVTIRDTVRFQAWGNISKQPALAPLVGLPCGVIAGVLGVKPWKDPAEVVAADEKIPLSAPKTWKTMKDYIDEASFAYPKYPALGGSGWRGLACEVVIFHWEYLQEIPLSSAQETEIRISLVHDRPFLGTFATATFYSLAETE